MSYLVNCINKIPRDDPHHGITHLGGPGGGGWKLPRSEIIAQIERGESFHTEVNGKRAEIGVRNGPYGKYVQTHADGQWNNNLLALRECN